jgi:hypothetical protein
MDGLMGERTSFFQGAGLPKFGKKRYKAKRILRQTGVNSITRNQGAMEKSICKWSAIVVKGFHIARLESWPLSHLRAVVFTIKVLL